MPEGFSFAVRRRGAPELRWGRCAQSDAEQLHVYALSLLDSDAGEAAGWWQTTNGAWLRVWLERDGAPGERVVLVTGVPSPPPYGLTPRELDVLTLMCGGLTNREIAEELVTSVRTVSTQVAAVLGKLNRSTRAGATSLATAHRAWRLPIPARAGQPLSPLDVGGHGTSPQTRLRKAPLRIGSVVPGSGPCASDGQAMVQGAALAIDEINRRGGIGGRHVEHVPVPVDVFSAGAAVEAFSRLLASDCDAITSGYFMAGAGEELWTLLGETDVPVLHAMTSQRWVDRVAQDPHRLGNVFHVCPSESGYLSGLARALKAFVASTTWRPADHRLVLVGSFRVSGDHLEDTVDALLAEDWELERRSSPLDDPGLLDVLEENPPAVALVVEHDPEVLARFICALTSRSLPTLVYQLYTPSMPDYLAKAGAGAEGVLWATVTGTYGDALGVSFIRRFRERYGMSPGRSHAGIAYDEICLLGAAWATVADVRAGRQVADRLRTMPYRGVNGSYYFDHPGQHGLSWRYDTPDASLAQAHLVLQIQNGSHRIIWPSTYAETSFVAPPWFERAALAAAR